MRDKCSSCHKFNDRPVVSTPAMLIIEVYQDKKGKSGISSSFSLETGFSISNVFFSLVSICYGEPGHFNCDAYRLTGDGMRRWCHIDDMPLRPTVFINPPTSESLRDHQSNGRTSIFLIYARQQPMIIPPPPPSAPLRLSPPPFVPLVSSQTSFPAYLPPPSYFTPQPPFVPRFPLQTSSSVLGKCEDRGAEDRSYVPASLMVPKYHKSTYHSTCLALCFSII
mmetsp:Transcript_37706/g.76263  ORF Transcript_37706/g.76263 Transcript_37706/m.76263 type:complete len:223 (+) Transcript_37706:428-1096(+)